VLLIVRRIECNTFLARIFWPAPAAASASSNEWARGNRTQCLLRSGMRDSHYGERWILSSSLHHGFRRWAPWGTNHAQAQSLVRGTDPERRGSSSGLGESRCGGRGENRCGLLMADPETAVVSHSRRRRPRVSPAARLLGQHAGSPRQGRDRPSTAGDLADRRSGGLPRRFTTRGEIAPRQPRLLG
jgi:hypothetical protein